MSKTYLMSSDTIKTICQGALGALSFGAYHQFTTNKIMELNNKNMENTHKNDIMTMEMKYKNDMMMMENQHKNDMMTMENQHKNDMEKIMEKMNKLEKRWIWQ